MKMGEKLYGNYLDSYEIVEQIGEGGNSNVYKVKSSSGEVYALKLLNKNSSTEKIKRFKNELEFCKKYSNKNIINIIDNGITDDKKQIFYIMPLYKKTLRNFIDEKHTIEEKIQVFINILNGVNFYQSKKIIHRDLKPENILLNEENNPVISDFGIAHFSEDELATIVETKLGSKMANFQYAAPEQREKHADITYKADIYALGLILNELFTKKVPYGASYRKIVDVESEISFFDEIVNKMILQDPISRYDSIDEIIFSIKNGIENQQRQNKISELKQLEYKDMGESDLLILEPPKLINFKYSESINQLFLYLDKKVSNEWIDCMTAGSYGSILGFGPEKFRFENEVAIAQVSPSRVDSLPQIINYFKSWVENANKHYPTYIEQKRKREKILYEQEMKSKIEKEEKLKKIMESIKI